MLADDKEYTYYSFFSEWIEELKDILQGPSVGVSQNLLDHLEYAIFMNDFELEENDPQEIIDELAKENSRLSGGGEALDRYVDMLSDVQEDVPEIPVSAVIKHLSEIYFQYFVYVGAHDVNGESNADSDAAATQLGCHQ